MAPTCSTSCRACRAWSTSAAPAAGASPAGRRRIHVRRAGRSPEAGCARAGQDCCQSGWRSCHSRSCAATRVSRSARVPSTTLVQHELWAALQHHLKDLQQIFSHLEIALVAGVMKRDQDLVRQSPCLAATRAVIPPRRSGLFVQAAHRPPSRLRLRPVAAADLQRAGQIAGRIASIIRYLGINQNVQGAAGWSIGLVISTICRTGRLLAASIPASSSPRPARRRSRRGAGWAMRSRIGMARCRSGACTSFSIRSLTQRSQVMRVNHDGNAASGSSRASRAGGQRLVAVAAPVPLGDRSRGHRGGSIGPPRSKKIATIRRIRISTATPTTRATQKLDCRVEIAGFVQQQPDQAPRNRHAQDAE